jgi:hypothetical protein
MLSSDIYSAISPRMCITLRLLTQTLSVLCIEVLICFVLFFGYKGGSLQFSTSHYRLNTPLLRTFLPRRVSPDVSGRIRLSLVVPGGLSSCRHTA